MMGEHAARPGLCGAAVFVCGAAVMIFEIAGSRVLAPYAGASLFVWTSLIGVILASLSAGYWSGGLIADRRPSAGTLALIIFLAAAFVAATACLKDALLARLRARVEDQAAFSLAACAILFSPASVCLGMVPPFAVRLKLRRLERTGSAVGALYALSAAGSIAGTFLAGFVLIPRLGSTASLLIVSFALGCASIAVRAGASAAPRVLLLAALPALCRFPNRPGGRELVADIDTAYSRAWIYRDVDEETGRPVLLLSTDPYGQESGIYLDGEGLALDYMRFFRLAGHFVPGLARTLLIGGAAYAYPKDHLARFPGAAIDVVEIDPMLTTLSRKYFKLCDDPRLTIYHEDGRVFLNRTRSRYDVVIIDAFRDSSCIPFHLATLEAARRVHAVLNDGGAVFVNLIGAIEGPGGRITRAEYATYADVFPRVYIFPVSDPGDGLETQNVVLVALKSDAPPPMRSENAELDGYLRHLWRGPIEDDLPVLTDDRAPVEYYLAGAG